MNRFKSIKWALLGWFLIIALIPMGMIGWYGYRAAVTSITEIQNAELESTADRNVQLVKDWFIEVERDLQAWAGLPAPKDAFFAILKGWKKSGMPLVNYVKTPEYQRDIAYGQIALKNLQRHYEFMHDMFMIDLDGNIVYSIQQEEDFISNLRSGKYASTLFARAYRETLADGKSHFSDLEYYEASKGMLSGFVTAPIRNDAGKMIGVMVLQLRIDGMFKRLDNMQTDQSVIRHYMVGPDGLLRTKRGNHGILKERISTELFWKWNNQFGAPIGVNKERKMEDTMRYVGPDGIEVLGRYYAIDVLGVHWAHISEIPLNEVQKPSQNLLRVMMVMFLIGVGGIIITARFLSRRITDPIIKLREASRAYEAGEDNVTLLINANNEIGELAIAFNDMVSKQQKSAKELALLAESEKLKSVELNNALEVKRGILDAAGAMIVTIDTNGIITSINKAGEQMIGYSREELVGKQSPAILHKADEVLQRAKLLSAELGVEIASGLEVFVTKAKRGIRSMEEWTYVRKDGSEFSAYTTVNALKDEDGIIFGYLAVVTDVTEMKKVQKESLRLSQVVGQSPHPTVITDTEGRIEYSNLALLQLSGYTPEELLGQKMSIFRSGKHSVFIYQSLWDQIGVQQKVWRGTLINQMKNGEYRDWDSTIFPLFDAKGVLSNYVSIVNDVTEINAKERLLLVQSRQAQMGEMLSMIAHQWRQPLAIINALVGKILLQELLKEQPDEELNSILKQIENQSLFLSRTITDFRDFFRADKAKEDITCSQLVKNAISLIDHALKTHSLEVITTFSSDPVVNTYANEVLQVLITLMKNSLDAFDESSESKKVLELITDTAGDKAIISVKDNAGGIKPEILQEIFSPYFTTKVGDKGTGLGLYMAKVVVEEHCQGLLNVESEGGITIFRIFLPLAHE